MRGLNGSGVHVKRMVPLSVPDCFGFRGEKDDDDDRRESIQAVVFPSRPTEIGAAALLLGQSCEFPHEPGSFADRRRPLVLWAPEPADPPSVRRPLREVSIRSVGVSSGLAWQAARSVVRPPPPPHPPVLSEGPLGAEGPGSRAEALRGRHLVSGRLRLLAAVRRLALWHGGEARDAGVDPPGPPPPVLLGQRGDLGALRRLGRRAASTEPLRAPLGRAGAPGVPRGEVGGPRLVAPAGGLREGRRRGPSGAHHLQHLDAQRLRALQTLSRQLCAHQPAAPAAGSASGPLLLAGALPANSEAHCLVAASSLSSAPDPPECACTRLPRLLRTPPPRSSWASAHACLASDSKTRRTLHRLLPEGRAHPHEAVRCGRSPAAATQQPRPQRCGGKGRIEAARQKC